MSHLALGILLYACGDTTSIKEAASHFKHAIHHNAHEGDSLTLYRAALCFEDAVSVQLWLYYVVGAELRITVVTGAAPARAE